MAIDSRNKRSSAIKTGRLFLPGFFPVPDGSISGTDKKHISASYAGIVANAVSLDMWKPKGAATTGFKPKESAIAEFKTREKVNTIWKPREEI
jgi:hypothetical protein